MKTIGVVLSGCGVFDGAEIHESVIALLALDRSGALLDDFHLVDGERAVHVVSAPSPAATASLAIGEVIAERVLDRIAGR